MISIIIPLFNERESLEILYKEIIKILDNLHEDWEIIFIDDGSTDDSLSILKKIAQHSKNIRIFSFRKNQGKAEALTLGFAKANGEYIITLDADLQDKPSEIQKLLSKTKEGWDLVCGWRKNRKDTLIKVLASRFFNFLAGFLWDLRLHDYNCGLKIYTKNVAKSLRLYGGLHRFIPLLAFQQGFTVCEIAVLHEKRRYGKSKFGFSKIWKDFPDMFTMLFLTRYSNRPFHFFGAIGGILILIGILILSYLSAIWFQGQSIGRRPLLFLGMLLVLTGFQIFFTGFLADMIINIFHNGRKDLNQEDNILLKYSTD